MINHVRTLLLNRSGSERPGADYFLEEYVPPAFGALELPTYLQTLHDALVGAGADDAWANFRMRQYTTVLHATEFVAYVLDLDSRVTYLRERSTLDTVAETEVTGLNVFATTTHNVGSLAPSANQPRLLYEWNVQMLTPLQARTTDLRTGESADRTLSVTNGLSSPVVMAGQESLGIMIENPVIDAAWKVSSFAPPPQDLSSLMAQLRVTGGATLARLFAGDEPYATFKELWEKNAVFAYQLSGLLLAFAYRAEDIRVGET